MKLFYCDEFVLPLPSEHRFPMAKYRLLRERVESEPWVPAGSLAVPAAATDTQLARVHAADYIAAVVEGSLDATAVRRIGFPWSPELVERSRRSVGGTIAAARSALVDGSAGNLAGGTHHAFHDRGGGYCVFNDAAVAARAMQQEEGVGQILIVDCDVHQGDGTASIFAQDPSVATFSIHGRRNYPFRKQLSDVDVELEDGADDRTYLAALRAALPPLVQSSAPELAIYVAGADPYRDDRLGRMALTRAGLRERDRFVFDTLAAARIPFAVVMAGGYALEVDRIVDIHLATLAEAAAVVERHRAGMG